MLALAEQRRLPIYVVMTMRSDFLGDCDNFHGLPEMMNRSQYLVPRLTRQQRQQAIEGPIRLFGGSVSPRLLDRLLNDVGDKSDQLPVMQHALMRTWERWQFENAKGCAALQIDMPHYEAAGGIKDALSKDAETALNGLSDDELKIVERMFQALTDTDARNRRVRRPAHLSEIEAIAGADRETVLKIIERFRSTGRSFLTVTDDDDPLIDISHESLIRQWERIGKWVKSEVESRDLYLRLVDSAKKGRELWRGSDLAEGLRWREQKQPNSAWARRYDGTDGKAAFGLSIDFLERSLLQEDLEAKEREKGRRLKLRNTRAFALILAVAFLLALFSALYIRKQQLVARELAREAVNQNELAVAQRKVAETTSVEAQEQRRKAEEQVMIAEYQKKSAENQKRIAEEAKRELLTSLATTVANQGEAAFYSWAGAIGVWINTDGSFEFITSDKPTDDELRMFNSFKTLQNSLKTLRQVSQNAAPQRIHILTIRENARDVQQNWRRVSTSEKFKTGGYGELELGVSSLLANVQNLIDTGLRLL